MFGDCSPIIDQHTSDIFILLLRDDVLEHLTLLIRSMEPCNHMMRKKNLGQLVIELVQTPDVFRRVNLLGEILNRVLFLLEFEVVLLLEIEMFENLDDLGVDLSDELLLELLEEPASLLTSFFGESLLWDLSSFKHSRLKRSFRFFPFLQRFQIQLQRLQHSRIKSRVELQDHI